MKLYDVSQVPVMDGKQIVGLIDESDLLLAVSRDAQAFRRPTKEFMTTRLETISRHAAVDDLLSIFDAGKVAIIADESGFDGLITRIDVLNYLRRQQKAA
jgi:cystathionine beta-synthase